MLNIKFKKVLAGLLSAAMVITLLPCVAFAESSPAGVTDYLKDEDIIVISPAQNIDSKCEKYDIADSHGWSLTIQNNNSKNGDDLQMWHYGVSDKLRVWDINYTPGGDEYKGAFRLLAVNWRETLEDNKDARRFLDIEHQSKSEGANVHVWKEGDDADDNMSKWFKLVKDNDSDPETFYIMNVKSNKYLAPENFFNTKKDYNGRQCLAEGKNTVLSSEPFRWRVEVINRTPDSVQSTREWMSRISDDKLLSEINIPGTHDSSTANVEGSWNEGYNLVACQKYFIPEQLQVGVRAFDLRMLKKSNGLVMVHGQNWAVCHKEDNKANTEAGDLTFDQVMDYFREYLAEHPGETIIALFKNDGGNKEETSTAFRSVIDKNHDIMYDWSNPSPTLGEVRGKVVGFSRIDGVTGSIYGPDLSEWDDLYDPGASTTAQKITSEGKPDVYVQDDYSDAEISVVGINTPKSDFVYDTVKDANDGDEKAASKYSYLFNYVSCETPLIYTPLMAARDLNEYIRTDGGKKNFYSYIKEKKRLGITMMDYIDAQLAKMIYNSNELSTVQSYAKAAVKATKPSLRSSIVQNKTGKKCVKTTWTIPSDIKLDGIEVYRSTERNKGYGTEPFYTLTKGGKTGSYINTKSLKKGIRYYYKARGYVLVDGEKVYTQYSNKAFRTI